jgi:hypothetical protein
MRKNYLVSLLALATMFCTTFASANTVSVNVSFDPVTDDFTPYSTYISRDQASPINLSLGDTLQVTYSGLPDVKLTDVNDVMNAFIIWTPYRSSFPIFNTTFHVLDYSGDLVSTTFSPSSTFGPGDFVGGCPYPSQILCRTNDYYKTLGIVPDGKSASIRSVEVDFELVSGVDPGDPLGISTLQFETFSFAGSVPEPPTWAMMLIGFFGLGFAGYNKRWTSQLQRRTVGAQRLTPASFASDAPCP